MNNLPINPRNRPDLTGNRYGLLTVLSRHPDKRKDSRWLCQCDCGEQKIVLAITLKQGGTKSCGCARKILARERATTHGMTKSPTHQSWGAMLQRCQNKQCRAYPSYGGRGIKICERWLNSFESFLADMGVRPSLDHSLDRINNDGNYEPTNCRWATSSEQNLNKRNSRLITHNGVTLPLSTWARNHNLDYNTLSKRIATFNDFERALNQPRRVTKPRTTKIL